jgi:hypothetical protein
MTKAKQFSVGMAKYYYGKQHHNAPSSSDASNDITHSLPHNKMYVISYHETDHNNGRHMGGCTARLTGMNPSTQIHPVILSWLADNWEIEIGSDRDSIKCYTEMKVKEGRHVITKWGAIALGSYVWKRHTYAAAGSYP